MIDRINVAVFAPAADAAQIKNGFNSVSPGKYAVLIEHTDFSDSRARRQVIEAEIQLVVVHQGVQGFTLEGLRILANEQGKTPRVVAAFLVTEGNLLDIALEYNCVVYELPILESSIAKLHADFPTSIVQATKRFMERTQFPEMIDPDVVEWPNLLSVPGKTRQALQVLTVWGSKGGTGKSTLAMELSRMLSEFGDRKVLLVDADTSRGYIAPRLGQLGEREVARHHSIVNLAQVFYKTGSLKDAPDYFFTMPKILDVHRSSSLEILFGLHSIEQASFPCFSDKDETQGQIFVNALVQWAQNMGYEFVIFDIGPSVLVHLHLGAIRAASSVLIVSDPLYPSIRPTADAIEKIVSNQFKSRERMSLVLNRWVDFDHARDEVFSDIAFAQHVGLTLISAIPSVHDKIMFPIVNRGEIVTDYFVKAKDPPEALNGWIVAYLGLAERFSMGIANTAEARFGNIKKALRSGREGIHGIGDKHKKKWFSRIFGGRLG